MRTAFAIACATALCAITAAPAQPARPLVPLMDAAAISRSCEAGLARARAAIAKLAAGKGGTGLFDEWNRLQIQIEDTLNPVYLLGSVDPDKAVRDAAEPCLQNFTTLNTEIFQDERLFARAQAARPATARQAKLRKDLLEGFEDAGVGLPPASRTRAKEIFDRLEERRQAFNRNIRDDPTKVAFRPGEVEGMPEAWLKDRKRDDKGNYVAGLDYPSYFPFLQNAKSGEARKRYYFAKMGEGSEKNLAILDEIAALRKELAGLYGLDSYAQYALRRRMVEKPETVAKFLGDVKAAVAQAEQRDLEELRAEKSKDLGTPPGETRIERWDVPYYLERVKRARYSIDQEALRKYFPTPKAVEYAFAVSETLYGLKIREVKMKAWHPDVRYFDVLDAKTGAFISGFYLDLFPREGKYNHAAAFPVRGVSTLAHRTPLSALVANFNRDGLNHDELETLLHEFGHVLHGVLSKTDFNPHAGTSTLVDFVEAPSQMFEEWARREQPLALFAKVCPECPRLSPDQIKRLDDARRYGKGISYARQWLYAAFDLALCSANPRPALQVWKEMESATILGHPEGTIFPASFSHIAGGYAAGYYGYMWSEVLALDMLSAFKGNLLDAQVGRRYRDTILSQGGQEEPQKLVRRFLGREPDSKAFFEEITGKR